MPHGCRAADDDDGVAATPLELPLELPEPLAALAIP
jgi:hypothetical protein